MFRQLSKVQVIFNLSLFERGDFMKGKQNTVEYEFRVKFGCYPYTYYLRQRDNGLSHNDALNKVRVGIDLVWKNMKYTYSRQTLQNLVDAEELL